MTFDPSKFTDGLDALRALWIEAQPHLSGREDASLGFVNSRCAAGTSTPIHHLGGTWETASNHEAVAKGAFVQRIKKTVDQMDAGLRGIPALDFPELEWHIAFRRDGDLPSYRMVLQRERLSTDYLKITAPLGEYLTKLHAALRDFGHNPKGEVYLVDNAPFRAACAHDAAQIRAHLRNTI